jgi:hypothetical protein
MDASQITKLREKQQTQYINRNKCNDASTLIWQNQIRSSTYISGSNVQTCDGSVQNTPVPTPRPTQTGSGYCYGGKGNQMTLMTGSTQQYPSVYAGASGSASRLYSSESIMLQKAGLQACGTPLSTAQPLGVILPTCYCGTNGPSASNPTPSVNDSTNPYLPAFDTYYAAKNTRYPCIDENQKHTVTPCCAKP